MKSKQKKELRQKDVKTLIALVTKKREELKKARLYMLEERNKNKLKNMQKEVAFISTIIKEKKED